MPAKWGGASPVSTAPDLQPVPGLYLLFDSGAVVPQGRAVRAVAKVSLGYEELTDRLQVCWKGKM